MKPILDPEGQLLWLRDRLAGHDSFARVRGASYKGFREIAGQSTTPSEFRTKWDVHADDMRVLGQLLLQLRRDGWQVAAKELDAALQDERHVLYGEVLAESSLRPTVVAVPELAKIAKILAWLRNAPKEDHEALGRSLFSNDAPEFPAALRDLFTEERVAEAMQYAKARRGHLSEAIADCMNREIFHPAFERVFWHIREWEVVRFEMDSHGGAFWKVSEWSWLRLFPEGSGKGTPIGRMTPEERARLTEWELPLPRSYSERSDFRLGLHPEADHERWSTEPGVFASTGTAGGWGIAAFRDETPAAKKYLERYGLVSLDGNGSVRRLGPDDPFGYVMKKAWR